MLGYIREEDIDTMSVSASSKAVSSCGVKIGLGQFSYISPKVFYNISIRYLHK